jgi:hypothetical protein
MPEGHLLGLPHDTVARCPLPDRSRLPIRPCLRPCPHRPQPPPPTDRPLYPALTAPPTLPERRGRPCSHPFPKSTHALLRDRTTLDRTRCTNSAPIATEGLRARGSGSCPPAPHETGTYKYGLIGLRRLTAAALSACPPFRLPADAGNPRPGLTAMVTENETAPRLAVQLTSSDAADEGHFDTADQAIQTLPSLPAPAPAAARACHCRHSAPPEAPENPTSRQRPPLRGHCARA